MDDKEKQRLSSKIRALKAIIALASLPRNFSNCIEYEWEANQFTPAKERKAIKREFDTYLHQLGVRLDNIERRLYGR